MKIALTDLGSNTVRMSVYDVDEEKKFQMLFSEKQMAGLASYIDKGLLSAEGIDKACQVLQGFQWLLRQFDMTEMKVFATASLRNIDNTGEAVAAIRDRTGLEVDVISGETEARLDYYGAMLDSGIRDGSMFDIGGGSTEIVSVRQGIIQSAQSLPVGSLNLFNRFVTRIWPGRREMEKMERYIRKNLDRASLPEKADQVCGIGGTARAVLKIANAHFGKEADNRTLTGKELRETVKILTDRESEARRLILKCCPDRAHTILPGAMMMENVCDKLCAGGLYISKYGVREGYLCHKLLQDGT